MAVASLTTKSASPSQKSPSPSSAKSVARDQTRPPSLTSVTPTNNGGVQSLSPFVPQRSLPNSAARQPPRRKIMAWQDTRSVLNREIRGAKGFFGSKRSARTLLHNEIRQIEQPKFRHLGYLHLSHKKRKATKKLVSTVYQG